MDTSITVALITFAGTLLVVYWQRRKDRKSIADDFGDLLEKYQELSRDNVKLIDEVADLKKRLLAFEKMFDEVVRGAWILHSQVLENGKEPRYTPPELPQ